MTTLEWMTKSWIAYKISQHIKGNVSIQTKNKVRLKSLCIWSVRMSSFVVKIQTHLLTQQEAHYLINLASPLKSEQWLLENERRNNMKWQILDWALIGWLWMIGSTCWNWQYDKHQCGSYAMGTYLIFLIRTEWKENHKRFHLFFNSLNDQMLNAIQTTV